MEKIVDSSDLVGTGGMELKWRLMANHWCKVKRLKYNIIIHYVRGYDIQIMIIYCSSFNMPYLNWQIEIYRCETK